MLMEAEQKRDLTVRECILLGTIQTAGQLLHGNCAGEFDSNPGSASFEEHPSVWVVETPKSSNPRKTLGADVKCSTG